MGFDRGAVWLAACLLAGCVTDHGPSPLSSFEAALAANDSATSALSQWCAERRMAEPSLIVANQIHEKPPVLTEAERALLDVDSAAHAGHRHVRLSCGAHVLSDAHNWYVPTRLTEAMNQRLATTTAPFGIVAAPLGFRRERLASRRGAALGCPAGTVLAQRAVLRLPDGAALAVVTECYTRAVLGR